MPENTTTPGASTPQATITREGVRSAFEKAAQKHGLSDAIVAVLGIHNELASAEIAEDKRLSNVIEAAIRECAAAKRTIHENSQARMVALLTEIDAKITAAVEDAASAVAGMVAASTTPPVTTPPVVTPPVVTPPTIPPVVTPPIPATPNTEAPDEFAAIMARLANYESVFASGVDGTFNDRAIPHYKRPRRQDVQWVIEGGVARNVKGQSPEIRFDVASGVIGEIYRQELAKGNQHPIIGIVDDAGPCILGGRYNPRNPGDVASPGNTNTRVRLSLVGMSAIAEVALGIGAKFSEVEHVVVHKIGIRGGDDSFVLRCSEAVGEIILDEFWLLPLIKNGNVEHRYDSGMHLENWTRLLLRGMRNRGKTPESPGPLFPEHGVYLKCAREVDNTGTMLLDCEGLSGNRTSIVHRRPGADVERYTHPNGPRDQFIVMGCRDADFGWAHEGSGGGGAITVWAGVKPVYLLGNVVTGSRYASLVVGAQGWTDPTFRLPNPDAPFDWARRITVDEARAINPILADRNWYAHANNNRAIGDVYIESCIFENNAASQLPGMLRRGDRDAATISGASRVFVSKDTQFSSATEADLVIDNEWALRNSCPSFPDSARCHRVGVFGAGEGPMSRPNGAGGSAGRALARVARGSMLSGSGQPVFRLAPFVPHDAANIEGLYDRMG